MKRERCSDDDELEDEEELKPPSKQKPKAKAKPKAQARDPLPSPKKEPEEEASDEEDIVLCAICEDSLPASQFPVDKLGNRKGNQCKLCNGASDTRLQEVLCAC